LTEYEYKDFTLCYPPNSTLSPLTLTGNQVLNNIGVQCDKDADFFLEMIEANYTGLAYAATFIDHTQYALSSAPVGSFAFAAAQTGLAQPYCIMPSIMFPAGSAIIMNLIEQSGSTNGPIQFLFRGTKRYMRDPRVMQSGQSMQSVGGRR
jgi:hypothetical protein